MDEADRGNDEVEATISHQLDAHKNRAQTSYSEYCISCDTLIPQARQDFFETGTDKCVDCS